MRFCHHGIVQPHVRLALFLAGCALAAFAPAAETYRPASPAVSEYLRSAAPPMLLLNPQRDRMLIYRTELYPDVATLAIPEVKLAGMRFRGVSHGPSRVNRCASLELKALFSERPMIVRVPRGARISVPKWSPNGKVFAFMRVMNREVSLFVGDGETGRIRRIDGVRLNGGLGNPVQWLPDGETLLCQLVPGGFENFSESVRPPRGPVVQETTVSVPTAAGDADFLTNENDETLLESYGASQLALVHPASGKVTPLGLPAIFSRTQASPDGHYILVSFVARPYPHDVGLSDFPRRVEVWSRTGETVFHLADIPKHEGVPAGGVLNAPRYYNWRPSASAELVWIDKPLDGGHPGILISHRDRVLALRAPFVQQPEEMLRTEGRIESIIWGEQTGVALVREFDAERGVFRTALFNPDRRPAEMETMWMSRSADDYSGQGKPMMRSLPNGQQAMRIYQNSIYLAGGRPSVSGERPFLDLFNLTTREVENVFESGEDEYERVIALLEPDAATLVTLRETAGEPPNYHVLSFPSRRRAPLTDIPAAVPELAKIHRQMISYERPDGVKLSFVLHLPPNYDMRAPDRQRLPTILWVHPRTQTEADLSGQVRDSLRRYPVFKGASHRFLALSGYAVLDSVTLPVLGEPSIANDTFVEQIIAGAKAAIVKAVELGFADPSRIGVGGHSYGAFLAANLMAHTDLFRAGVTRSGAYNRTLTPFGFQHEKRSLWQAPELYTRLSPLMFANRIETPLLLIHGVADDNPATDPVQSRWMYQAIEGNGGTARLVLLPFEGHRYEAIESVEHVTWEMSAWYDRYLKPTRATVPEPEPDTFQYPPGPQIPMSDIFVP
ncbi:MAG: S9 family peptidase [Verrucomicrobiae bacterium]|nr:S9 family peptidase [Verrucomicrobiae bacterium]